MASSNAWRSRNWRHSGAVMCRYVPSTILLAANESAVTKNPRLRLMMRRSSSVNPLGSFHKAMSRVMLTSCGIQWLAQLARYFSQAHLYLNGTSWFTSVLPLMMRLSEAFMRRGTLDFSGEFCARSTGRLSDGVSAKFVSDVGLTSSSQVNINNSNQRIMRAVK